MGETGKFSFVLTRIIIILPNTNSTSIYVTPKYVTGTTHRFILEGFRRGKFLFRPRNCGTVPDVKKFLSQKYRLGPSF